MMDATQTTFQKYPAYKDSGVEWLGEIPEHWEVKRLKFVLALINEKVSSLDSGLPYVGMENVESKSGRYIHTSSEVDGLSNRFKVGDILFGKLRPYLAKVYLADFDGICSTEFLVYKSSNSGYFSKLLLSDKFIQVVDGSTYGAKMPRASSDFIGNLEIPIPPAHEQTAIAAFLDDKTAKIDRAIAQKEKMIALLKERKQIIIQHAVTKGLNQDLQDDGMNRIDDGGDKNPAILKSSKSRFRQMKDSGVEWIGEVPEGWEVKRLKFLIN